MFIILQKYKTNKQKQEQLLEECKTLPLSLQTQSIIWSFTGKVC